MESGYINKNSSDDQAPIIYPRLTPHCILTLANYAFPTSFSFLRLLTDLQGNSVYKKIISMSCCFPKNEAIGLCPIPLLN